MGRPIDTRKLLAPARQRPAPLLSASLRPLTPCQAPPCPSHAGSCASRDVGITSWPKRPRALPPRPAKNLVKFLSRHLSFFKSKARAVYFCLRALTRRAVFSVRANHARCSLSGRLFWKPAMAAAKPRWNRNSFNKNLRNWYPPRASLIV